MNSAEPSDESSIRQQLGRIRASSIFTRCESLFNFLEYVVEETLAGRGNTLKELVIGDALYGHQAPYDPRIDSTVRVEARRLRRKLDDYFAGEGKQDEIRIDLPVGGYRPHFGFGGGTPSPLIARERLIGGAPKIDLAVMPFRALSTDCEADWFADGLTDELMYAFERGSSLKLAPRLATFQFKDRKYSLSEAAHNLNALAMLHGTCRSAGGRTRITVELSNPQGFVTWSAQVEEFGEEPMSLQERLAASIMGRMPTWIIGKKSGPAARLALAS